MYLLCLCSCAPGISKPSTQHNNRFSKKRPNSKWNRTKKTKSTDNGQQTFEILLNKLHMSFVFVYHTWNIFRTYHFRNEFDCSAFKWKSKCFSKCRSPLSHTMHSHCTDSRNIFNLIFIISEPILASQFGVPKYCANIFHIMYELWTHNK